MTDDRGGAGSGRSHAWRWLLALGLVALLQWALASPTIRPYDEGLILYGASRVAHGGVPYRDFWSLYGPGSFYVLGLLDLLFGESMLVARAFDAMVRAALVTLVYAMARRRADRALAAAAAAVAFLLLVAVRAYLLPAFAATACAFVSMLLLERALVASSPVALEPRAAKAWFATGVAVGATFLFRPDFGMATALACVLVLPAPARAVASPWPTGRLLGAFVAGAALVVAPALVALLSVAPLADVWEQLVTLPARVYVAQRSLPFPPIVDTLRAAIEHRDGAPLLRLTVYLAPLVTVAGLVVLGLAFRRHKPSWRRDPAAWRWLAALLVLDAMLCLKGAVRVQVVHFLPALLISLVVVAHGLAAVVSRPASRRIGIATIAVLLTAGAIAAGRLALARPARQPATAVAFLDWRRCEGGPRLGCFLVEPAARSILAYLAAHARPGDTLYVGTGRHDRLFINNVELYFLSGLPAATRWHDLHPGVQTTREVQATMIREMTAHPPAFVVLNTAWDDHDEPNLSSASSGVTLLDDHLRARFVRAYAAGTYSVWIPREGGAPR